MPVMLERSEELPGSGTLPHRGGWPSRVTETERSEERDMNEIIERVEWAMRQGQRPHGIVRLYKHGRLMWECDNLFVNAGLTVLASLISGVTAGEIAASVGFGSGAMTPAVTDTDLTAAPKYYNAVGTHTIGPSGGVASGSVLFNYSLLTTDYGANGMTITELGLFAGAAALPAAIGTANPAWAASTAKVIGNLIVDSNGNIQRCTTAGTTGGSAPAWAATLNSTTNDGTAVWTLVAMHTAPSPMIAHVVVPAFPYSGTGNYSGTWTLSM